jgi:hypothetical protein
MSLDTSGRREGQTMKWAVLTITILAFTACGGKESVQAGASAAKNTGKPAMAASPSEYAGGPTAQASDKSATPVAPSAGVSGGAVSYQEFAKFRVDVEGLQVNQDGSVVIYLAYTNKTKDPIKISIKWHPYGLGYGAYTQLFDDAGNKYGIKFGTMVDGKLTIDPGNRGTATLLFALDQKGDKKQATRFSFTSSHVVKVGGGEEDSYNVSFRGVEPR